MSTVSVEIKGKEDVSTAAKKAATGLRDVGSSASSLASSFAPVAIAGAAVIGAIREIAQTVDECVVAFAENERASLAFNAAISQSGSITTAAASALTQFANEIAAMTGETGASVQSMETLLITSGRTEAEVRKLIEAAVDMSAATGKDLRSSVEQLNKTFGGTAGELGEIIPEMKSLTKEQLLAGEAVDLIAGKYDGLGEALANSVDVGLKNYKNAVTDLKAELGGLISQGLSPLRAWLTDIIRQWGEAAGAARNYTSAMAKAKGGAGIDSFTEQELVALNKARLAFIEQRKGVLLQLREGSDDFKTVTKQIDDAVADQQKIATALLDFSRSRAYAGYLPGEAPALPSAAPGGSSGGSAAPAAVVDAVVLGIETAFQGWNFEGTVAASAGIGEMPWAPAEDRSSGGSMLFGGGLAGLDDVLGPLIDSFGSMFGSMSMLQSLLDPIGTILSGVMDILGPLIETLLTPLVGIFRILGQTLGRIVAPLFEMLGPIIKGIAEVFVWLYNKVLRPIGNGIITLFNVVANMVLGIWNGIVAAINAALGWAGVNLSYASYRALDQGHLSEISVGDLSAAGSASSSSTTGANASYTQARDITVNVSVTTSALVGDDGIREFSLMIWREIKSAGVLGAA